MSTRPNPIAAATPYVGRKIITGDGVRLTVHDYGRPDTALHTVVLLHGLCLTQQSWAIQVGQLIDRWDEAVRIISYDHRGHGRSGRAPMHTYRIDRLAADLADVLSALRVTGPLTLAGHSMGGMVALAYLGRPAAQQPVQPAGLVLIASAAGRISERGLGRLLGTAATPMLANLVKRLPQRAIDQAMRGLIGPVRAALIRYPGRNRALPTGLAALAAESTRAVSLATATGFLSSLNSYDQYQTLASITAKTVVISGGADITTPDAHSRDLAAAIPGAVHLHQPAAGHMLLHDVPHSITAAINRVMGIHRRAAWTAGVWASRYGLPASLPDVS
ncbi:alpha/beta fold hydrolase [Mycobacterium szulgai]|uniref:alpha/beta fold hydrolase n=1 Tax=Mycobacterium szulgai TaxID=1787 RepID=UPI0021F29A99|nr:alpha/beta hydrolase [Mycobacterium szulgai]MCV7074534.1 alpha/beta hydrolase [Mycobacterium szulgai]